MPTLSLIETRAEPAGAQCPEGGQAILIGLDDDGDSELAAAETDSTVYVCNGGGLAAALDIQPLDTARECAAGGNLVSFGMDLDRDGALSPEESRGSKLVCDGAQGPAGAGAILIMRPLAPGAACPAGGVEIRSGQDTNGNQQLDAGEQVGGSQKVCNSQNGLNSLIRVTPIESGIECLAGGNLTQTGLDLDRDGILDDAEITNSVRQCNPCAALDGGACARGEFAAQAAFPLPMSTFTPDGLAVGDLNDDGRTDLVSTTATRTQGWLGVDGGVFGARRNSTLNFAVNRFAVKLADLNRDLKADLIGVSSDTSKLLVRPGNGDGTFGAVTAFDTCGAPVGVEVADFNGDSMLDVAVGCTTSPAIRLFFGTGSTTAFSAPVDFLPSQTMRVPFGLAAGDIDGDGDLDVISGASDRFGRSRVHVYRNDGGGRFSEPSAPYVITGRFLNLEVDRVNGDTVPDVVVAEGTNGPFTPETTTSVQVLLGKRDFSFEKGKALSFPGFSLDFKLGQLDSDGRLDLVVSDEAGLRLQVFRGL